MNIGDNYSLIILVIGISISTLLTNLYSLSQSVYAASQRKPESGKSMQ